jgi:hypothetical protein
MSPAICSTRPSIALAAFSKNEARWAAGSAAQPGKASCALSTARLASSASDDAYSPTTFEGRHGSRFSYVAPLALSRHSPLT